MKFYGPMGEAVARRSIQRHPDESWDEISKRVATGNAMLCRNAKEQVSEYAKIYDQMKDGVLLTSGRHLQHGDTTQPYRHMEVFTNCSTAYTTFALTYLLLNGSGVGRLYDNDLMVVNWDHMPNVTCVLNESHPDYVYTQHMTSREARHMYGSNAVWFEIQDSREGWASMVEYLELLAYERIHSDRRVILDFSPVRGKNEPIRGMQNRPSSGPVPLMEAINKIYRLKGANIAMWKQAMLVDHFLAEAVLVGGVRRSARMAVKYWKDPGIFDFAQVKRPIEFIGKRGPEIEKLRGPGSFLSSANNSVGVDEEFWELVQGKSKGALAKHAKDLFKIITTAGYYDGTGEPGIINLHKLPEVQAKIPDTTLGSDKYKLLEGTELMINRLNKVFQKKPYKLIVNPCGEIRLSLRGGYCVIADLALYFAKDFEQMHDAVKVAARFLIRVNTLPSLYTQEVRRTNRIGVALTGIFEMAWKFFKFDFHDLIDEEKSIEFWKLLGSLADTVDKECERYCDEVGLALPHTNRTIKPSGTISKLFGLSEGAHLLAMKYYLRWVQFKNGSPVIEEYRQAGYPVRELKSYVNTTIVGFPTSPLLTTIMPSNRIVAASEATPEQQYKWVMLLEKYWLKGDKGNQVSYTLKYDPTKVSFEEFKSMLLKYQCQIRCCSVMPKEKASSYEYTPEEEISEEYYQELMTRIEKPKVEEIEDISCDNGACPTELKPRSM